MAAATVRDARVLSPRVLHAACGDTLFALVVPHAAPHRVCAVAPACARHLPRSLVVCVEPVVYGGGDDNNDDDDDDDDDALRERVPVAALLQLPPSRAAHLTLPLPLPLPLLPSPPPRPSSPTAAAVVVVRAVVRHNVQHVVALVPLRPVHHASPFCVECAFTVVARAALAELRCAPLPSLTMREVARHARRDTAAPALALCVSSSSSSPSLLVVSRAGRVHVADRVTDCITVASASAAAAAAAPVVAHLRQPPVAAFAFALAFDSASPSRPLPAVALLGCFGALVVLVFHPSRPPHVVVVANLRAVVARFDFAPQPCAHARALLLRPTSHRPRQLPTVLLRVAPAPAALLLRLPFAPLSSSSSSSSPSPSPSPTRAPLLRALLRAMDRLALRAAQRDVADAAVQRRLEAAARLVPALAAPHHPPVLQLALSSRARGVVPNFHRQPPPRAAPIFLVARLRPSDAFAAAAALPTLSLRVAVDVPRASRTCTVFDAPLPLSGGEPLSFPLFVCSHAPLRVRAELLAALGPAAAPPLRVVLRAQPPLLDVLCMASSVGDNDNHDNIDNHDDDDNNNSNNNQRADHSAMRLARPFVTPRRAASLSVRLRLPFAPHDVARVLQLRLSHTAHFRTLLRAPFSLLLSAESNAAVVVIAAPAHVAPFVRAAVLRRVRALPPLHAVLAPCAPRVSAIAAAALAERPLTPLFAAAEDRLVDAVRVFSALPRAVDDCHALLHHDAELPDDGGLAAWLRAGSAAVRAYRAVRRERDAVWPSCAAAE
eukprot:gb/GEZJ01004260.1/.p1 GENE.gb/GEZJ01004260.1/~~gb/GEZJ01004260.1/.p1  ORF type:complete len:774 (-),score=216.48 gb/GEZJ01004260.1/:4949-7270(-)